MSKKDRGKVSGADLVLASARGAQNDGVPYAGRFAFMVAEAAVGVSEAPVLTEAIADRPLKDYEAAPVSIICAAVARAAKTRDSRAISEAVAFGAALLAKW